MDLKSLLNDLADEITTEKVSSMSQQDRTYHAVAQRLLMLERDLLGPGTPKPTDTRVERLLEALEKEVF